MKNRIGKVLLLFLCLTNYVWAQPANDALVFVVAGQSNAVSYIRGYKGKVLDYSPSGKVYINDIPEHPMKFFSPTRDHPTEWSIAWLYCGEEIVRLTGKDVVFVNIAKGSTTTTRWRNERTEDIVRTVELFKPKAILWHQGESDNMNSVPEQVSYKNMKEMIMMTRKMDPFVPWVVAINSNLPPSGNAPIRKAQKKIIAEGLALEGPDIDVMREDVSIMDKQGLHFVGDGYRQHGLMWFEAIKKNELLR